MRKQFGNYFFDFISPPASIASGIELFQGIINSWWCVITVLDSSFEPQLWTKVASTLRKRSIPHDALENGIVLPPGIVTQPAICELLFYGFDELCFFHDCPSDAFQMPLHFTSETWQFDRQEEQFPTISRYFDQLGIAALMADGCGLNFAIRADTGRDIPAP
jgi:hypothetical protein